MKNKKLQIIRNTVQIIFLILALAGLYLNFRKTLMLLLPATLLIGNYFCGWVCPFGTMQDVFGKIGNKLLKRKYKMPWSIQKYLQFSRYILMLSITAGIIGSSVDNINAYRIFLGLTMGKIGTTTSIIIMSSFVVISIFFDRPYCNYFCTEAAKFGVSSLTRLFTIKRNKQTCVGCEKCDKVCPMNINVSKSKNLRNFQCINCFQCISQCPVKGTLKYGFIDIKKKSTNTN